MLMAQCFIVTCFIVTNMSSFSETSSPKGNNCSPENQEVPSKDKGKVVGFFTLYGHGSQLGHVTWIFLSTYWFPIDASYKIWL